MSEELDITKVSLRELETMDGHEINYISKPDSFGDHRIIYHNDKSIWVKSNGKHTSYDVQIVRRKRRKVHVNQYINVYADGTTELTTALEDKACNWRYEDRIAVIHVNQLVEEGEGL